VVVVQQKAIDPTAIATRTIDVQPAAEIAPIDHSIQIAPIPGAKEITDDPTCCSNPALLRGAAVRRGAQGTADAREACRSRQAEGHLREGGEVGTKPERVDEIVKFAPGPNVRVEFTITDQQTGVPTTSKTVMLTTSNRQWGRIRTQITSRLYGGAPLNVDARPTVTQDGRINVELTIEYAQGRNSEAEANSDKIVQVLVNQSLTVLLENGKSLLVTQSADPVSDRK
jgi:hypothetical protein